MLVRVDLPAGSMRDLSGPGWRSASLRGVPMVLPFSRLRDLMMETRSCRYGHLTHVLELTGP